MLSALACQEARHVQVSYSILLSHVVCSAIGGLSTASAAATASRAEDGRAFSAIEALQQATAPTSSNSRLVRSPGNR